MGAWKDGRTTLLDLSAVDFDTLAMALEDHSYDGSWWLDPEAGEVWYRTTEGRTR
ncbi:MAG: hypothetical protein M3174_07165 [Actinomycetota bacterium]|nr:hypothetical protein [Actinomycetota bacterium]